MVVHFNWDEIESFMVPTEEVVGSGCSGSIYRGIIPDANERGITGQEVVIKMNLAGDTYRKIQLERDVLTGLDHENIINLIGWSEHKREHINEEGEFDQMCLVFPLMPNGALSSNIDALSFKQLLKVLTGIARGLDYLHQQGYIHHDLKPANVLVTEDFDAKIIDLGGANPNGQIHEHLEHTTGFRPAYDDPSIRDELKPISRPRTDVFAFGVIMIQLITKNRRVADNGKHISVILIEEGENATSHVHSSYYEQDCNLEMAAGYLNLALTLGYTPDCGQPFNPPAHTPTWAEVILMFQELDLQREENSKQRKKKKKTHKGLEKFKRGMEKFGNMFKKS